MSENEIALEKLNEFLEASSPTVTSMFVELFKGQQDSLSDEELTEAVNNEFDVVIERWQEEYKTFVDHQLMPIWKNTMKEAAQPFEQEYSIALDFDEPYIKNLLESQAEKFVARLNDELERSIKIILQKCQEKKMTLEQTVQFIRPTIGLYPRQAVTNWNFQLHHGRIFYIEPTSKVKKAPLKKSSFPEDEIEALKYSLEQLKQRAQMIADTGLAAAFNIGLHEIIRKAIALGLLGKVEKTWVTAKDQKVCSKCWLLSGVTIDFNEKFYESDVYTGETPPLHPNCRCAVVYREVLPPGVRPLTPEQMTKPNQSPELLGTLPNNPADKEEALKYYEGQIADQPIENALVFTADGEVYHATGDENTLDPILDLGDKLNDATVTHNHPTGESEYSFSDDDIALFMNYELERLRGIDDKFVYELNRNPEDIDCNDFSIEDALNDTSGLIGRHSKVIEIATIYGIGYRRWSK